MLGAPGPSGPARRGIGREGASVPVDDDAALGINPRKMIRMRSVVLVGEHGLLRFTPLVAVALGGAVLGLVAMMRHRLVSPLRLAGGASLLWLGLQVLLVAMVRDPDGGWAYGARRFAGVSGLLPIWMFLGVAAFRRRWPRETETGRLMDRCFRVLVVVAIIANLLTTWLALRGDLSLMPAS